MEGEGEEEAPKPKSPPKYPDLCGRHRRQVQIQSLNREIGFLQEELQSLEVIKSASKCCKEVDEYVTSNADPLIPVIRRVRRSARIWKCLRANLLCCFNFSCCFCRAKGCTCCGLPKCCNNHCYGCHGCCRCNCNCCCWDLSSCFRPCCIPKCSLPSMSCPEYTCGCICSCPKCTKACCLPCFCS
ncbi:Guanine nucleotide-binding protein subunit gamma 3 [Acorus calamus]|uniref:Guanine nucleotide-binding protein subunit gamma 3 n=1 Tax=Acorus calamus TaxID=4465 RepID=A0AAV9E232_ACOCL|nr:Guanine nucleotide-binding protein subunit gamma 3 [Acorus calamus]